MEASAWLQEVDDLLKARTVSNFEARKLYEQASRIVVADAADIWIYAQWYGPHRKNVRCSILINGQECRWISLA
jgi:hypothetical protein